MSALAPMPAFIASNVTDEEFYRYLLDRPEIPAYIRERFEWMAQRVNDAEAEAEEAFARAESDESRAQSDLDRYADLIEDIRAKWDALMGRIDSADEETPADVSAMEAAIIEAEDFNP